MFVVVCVYVYLVNGCLTCSNTCVIVHFQSLLHFGKMGCALNEMHKLPSPPPSTSSSTNSILQKANSNRSHVPAYSAEILFVLFILLCIVIPAFFSISIDDTLLCVAMFCASVDFHCCLAFHIKLVDTTYIRIFIYE